MTFYPPERVPALVEEQRVHRDLYLSADLFALEQRHLFTRCWLFMGHLSQVPKAGDYLAQQIAGRPLLLLRQSDGGVRVLYNRCAHKGMPLVTDSAGNTGRFLRCPYHAWTYRLDGAPLAIPFKQGYEGTQLHQCESGSGLSPVGALAVYRDFVFVRLSPVGIGFADYFGAALGAIDDMADRSPSGRLTLAGGVLRSLVHCNWKMYLENINDTLHPLSAHESVTQAARSLWQEQEQGQGPPMALEQLLPFGADYDFFERMGARVYPHGHSLLGVNFSIHSAYQALPDYAAALRQAHGPGRAEQLLAHAPQNALLYPSLALKGSPLALRVIRPLAVDRTLIEAWSFRAEDAPALLHQRALSYNRLVFSPMSVVAHDDVHLFQSIQRGLRAEGNEWISLHRGFAAGERDAASGTLGGTNELLMRNQFRAWAHFMAPAQ